MSLERTISIIRPDAVAKNVIGEIYSLFEQVGLRIVAAKMMHLNRDVMGGTNPKETASDIIRGKFIKSIDENAVHGPAAPETAKVEIEYFFSAEELCDRTR